MRPSAANVSLTWAEALMGRDIQPIKISGEDRGRYRDKLQRSLEVFARMLREHMFDPDTSQVGLEIELNLVDERGAPSMKNADVLDAIADPAWATELGQFNLEINIPPRRLDGDAVAGLEQEVRGSLNDADAKARGTGSRLVMIGILPTLQESDLHEGVLSANARYRVINEQIFAARGKTCVSRSRAPSGWSPTPTASPPRPPAPACNCTSRSPRKPSRTTGTLPRPSRASRSRWRRTPRSCSAGNCGRRPGSRCSSRPPTRGRWSCSSRGCGPGCGSASAGSPRCSTCSRRTSGTSPPCCRSARPRTRLPSLRVAPARNWPR